MNARLTSWRCVKNGKLDRLKTRQAALSQWLAMVRGRHETEGWMQEWGSVYVYQWEGKVEHEAYRLRRKHTNGGDSNEIICIISTDNYALITKIHKGNEHNYVADTMGLWTYYTICTVVCKSLLLHFLLYGSQIKHFAFLYPHEILGN